jgi:hypothetical protein
MAEVTVSSSLALKEDLEKYLLEIENVFRWGELLQLNLLLCTFFHSVQWVISSLGQVSVSMIRDSKDISSNTFSSSRDNNNGFLSNGGSNTSSLLENSRSLGNGRVTANSSYPNGSINSPKNISLSKQVKPS